jgi:hypothetical protein
MKTLVGAAEPEPRPQPISYSTNTTTTANAFWTLIAAPDYSDTRPEVQHGPYRTTAYVGEVIPEIEE